MEALSKPEKIKLETHISTEQTFKASPSTNELLEQKKPNIDVTPAQPIVELIKPVPEKQVLRKPELTYFNQIDIAALYSANPQPVVINYFASPNNFYAQLVNTFNEFDLFFAQFQEYCLSLLESKITLCKDDIAKPDLALAAKFYEDDIWYRAKIGIKVYLIFLYV